MEKTRYFKGKVYKKKPFLTLYHRATTFKSTPFSIDKNTIRIQLHFYRIYSATVRGAVWLTKVFQGPLATILPSWLSAPFTAASCICVAPYFFPFS